MKYKLEWFDVNTENSIGVFEHSTYDHTDKANCPRCGKSTDYAESQVDETEQGRAIYGGWFECHRCGIFSQYWEL